jgi:pimeloyl-ACP methyl ester carboxylesterase
VAVTDTPDTHYAITGDGAHIAYQVLGDGPPDLLVMMTSLLPIEDQMQGRQCERFLRRIAAFSRVIRLDRRGMGMSDPVRSFDEHVYERWVDDILSVLDHVGCTEAAAFSTEQPSCTAPILAAATHPDRISRLVLTNPTARPIQAPDYPHGLRLDEVKGRVDEYVASLVAGSTSPSMDTWIEPNTAGQDEFDDWYLRARRRGLPPRAARAIFDNWLRTDLRTVLPAVRVPTLVIGRPEAPGGTFHARYVAEHIPAARYVEIPGSHTLLFLSELDPIVNEVEEFLTGTRGAPSSERVLATVLFSDIVDSTSQATALGDRAWAERLDDHDAMVRSQLRRFRGREVKTTGDGFLATFDGPARAILCGRAMVEGGRHLGMALRVGLHTGEVEQRGDDVGGVGVHIASRVANLARPEEVLVSRTVTDLVAGSGIGFEERVSTS